MAIKNDFAKDHEWKAASNECGVMRTGRARTTLRLTVSPGFPTWGEIIILPAMDFAITYADLRQVAARICPSRIETRSLFNSCGQLLLHQW